MSAKQRRRIKSAYEVILRLGWLHHRNHDEVRCKLRSRDCRVLRANSDRKGELTAMLWPRVALATYGVQ